MDQVAKGTRLWCEEWPAGFGRFVAREVTAREDSHLFQGVPYISVEDAEGNIQFHPLRMFRPVLDVGEGPPARYFRLDDQMQEVPCTEAEWEAFRSATVVQEQSYLRPFRVVTNFLGRSTTNEDPPLLWETIIHQGSVTAYIKHCAGFEAAALQHREAVRVAAEEREKLNLVIVDGPVREAIGRVRMRATLQPVDVVARDNPMATPQARRQHRDQMRLQSVLLATQGRPLLAEYCHENELGRWRRHLAVSTKFLEQEASPAELQLLLELFSFQHGLDDGGLTVDLAIDREGNRRVTDLFEVMAGR